ncbi:swr complex subunit [Echria macrotheca]|uniref:SWR1-complex protein 5 n=1 Tax=Echria macrotheca TaxID=438768 RepID=A0AAJ0BDB3_9PEZI|nr:swr complex subunit [Echria macrotheca]
MPPPAAVLDDNEDQYASEEDSDFAPDDGPANESAASDDEEVEGDKPTSGKRKRAATDAEAEDAGFENSGDEAIIEKAKKRRKKAKTKDTAAEVDGEDGDEGHVIKTRSMRAVEKAERRSTAASGPVTIDVDFLWAQMVSGDAPASLKTPEKTRDAPTSSSQADAPGSASKQEQAQPPTAATAHELPDFIKIKRTYNFAGKVHTEEKVVARESAEAKLYLAEVGENADAIEPADEPNPRRRNLKKAFRSAFEPIPDGALLRKDLNLGMSVRLRARELANEANAKKLNTVEKSRMDWAGYVDREGLKDELELAGKSKHSYTARQDFLARSEAIRDEDARRVRLAGKT